MARVSDPVFLRLDSSHPSPGSWPYLAAHPELFLRCESATRMTTLRRNSEVIQNWTDPTEALDWLQQHALALPVDSAARWIGFLSYDLGRLFEDLPSTAVDDLHLP